MQTIRHLVVGTDFSADAEQALETAIQLACSATARITVVHVCELGVEEDDDQRLSQCAEALARLVARRRRQGVVISGVLRSGRPWEKLDNVAAEVGAAVIVIGRRGANRGLAVAIGSVAERLVRSANRPVLTVPGDSDHVDAKAHQDDPFHGKKE